MSRWLREGDIIEIKKGMKVYSDIPCHFVYSNHVGNWKELTHWEVTIEGEFTYLAGKYVVTKTAMEGGGTGHGPNDVFPDGHHVYCEKIKTSEFDKGVVEVDFYQSGSFTAMITDIEPIGKAEKQWVTGEKDED